MDLTIKPNYPLKSKLSKNELINYTHTQVWKHVCNCFKLAAYLQGGQSSINIRDFTKYQIKKNCAACPF